MMSHASSAADVYSAHEGSTLLYELNYCILLKAKMKFMIFHERCHSSLLTHLALSIAADSAAGLQQSYHYTSNVKAARSKMAFTFPLQHTRVHDKWFISRNTTASSRLYRGLRPLCTVQPSHARGSGAVRLHASVCSSSNGAARQLCLQRLWMLTWRWVGLVACMHSI